MRTLSLALLLATLTACGTTSHWYFWDASAEHDWGYSGDIGPSHWANLSPDYLLADTGRAQSPIDLSSVATVPGDLPAILVSYQPSDSHWLNNGHTLQHNEASENHVRWGGVRYELAQYHMHTPSEHTIDGLHAAAEVHLVHQSAAGDVLVLAVLVVEGAEHDELLVEIENFPMHPGDESDLSRVHDPTELLPTNRGYWTYTGSFTTPPCTEGVTWLVLKEHVVQPDALLRKIGEILGRNNRPTMPLNGRGVTSSD